MRIVLSDIIISYAVGALWTLAFESPVFVFEKLMFGKNNKPKVENNRRMNDNNIRLEESEK